MMRQTRQLPGLLCASLLLGAGCIGRPNQANIALRKQIQGLESQVSDLKRENEASRAAIRALEASKGTVPTLPQDRLDNLFVSSGLELGRLTGGADLDRDKPGDEGIKVYAIPLDRSGDQIKAAGSFKIELFDLHKPDDNLVGRWTFSIEQARQSWYGSALLYEYILTCPWQERIPEHSELTLTVTFFDELTPRQFQVQRVIQVNPPRPS
jgi:hypothetical protein